ncbi:hypothetical protein [Endozoicomonas numazuensis]|uniref:PI3K/PI4K catalytic domain-containing protein n=1 Tax=Endozoicomonas numazuensis TaxID=1137799 RepID=A0A081NEI2_9GAMM|nr:hypothetical protein [Endozoicomonas numazuensis]KEQ16855.1 hypothetical protein GZ78_19525 [Endozoicomonas numazuensis]
MANPPSSTGVVNSSQPAPSHTSGLSQLKDPQKGKLDRHAVTALDGDKVEKKLSDPSKESRKAKVKKSFKDFFSIKSTPPKYQYNANVRAGGQNYQVYTNSPNLNVWTNNPNTTVSSNTPHTRVQHFQPQPYQGNPFQLQVPGLGVLQLQQPLTFPQTPFNFPPIYQHPPAPPPQPAKPVFAHIYQDEAVCKQIDQSRVTERFHMSEDQVGQLETLSKRELGRSERFPNTLDSAVAKRKSFDYQRLNDIVKGHQEKLTEKLPADDASIKAQGKKMIDSLEEGMQRIDTIFKTGVHYFPEEEVEILKDMRQQLNSERSLVLQVLRQDGASAAGEKLDWQAATEFKRLGYDLTHDVTQHLSEYQGKAAKSEEALGSGKAHTVTKLSFEEGSETIEKVFKSEDAVDTSHFKDHTAKGSYLNSQRPRFAARNLASQSLQDALGLKLLPKTELTVHNGKVGLLMDVAKGKQPFTARNGSAKDIPFDSKENPKVAAEIAKNLNSAEWLDCFCGQQDRNTGNYLIDPSTGQVTLVDNDHSFYPGQSSIDRSEVRAGASGWLSPWPGPPALIDREVLNKLNAITVDDITARLTGLLEPSEIKATISRLEELKEHAEVLEEQGLVVDDWETWKSKTQPPLSAIDFIKRHGSQSAYLNAIPALRTTESASQLTPKKPKPRTPSSL